MILTFFLIVGAFGLGLLLAVSYVLLLLWVHLCAWTAPKTPAKQKE
jgi:hypothetical protein